MPTTIHGEFYDLGEIKDLPILDVCSYLGIDVHKQGKNHWCRIRTEKTPSVILHPENNTFYDFGNGKHGSCIDLVSYATGKSFIEAVHTLGDAFCLTPLPAPELKHRFQRMTPSDYARIGLYSDLATKNFEFPVEHFSLEKIAEIEGRYQISMNALKNQHPKVYERIIREQAIPYVENLRNLYYLNVWNYYSMLQSFQRSYLFFDSARTMARFEEESKTLKQAERALSKACFGTSIKSPSSPYIDPFRVIHLFDDGRLTISVGRQTPMQLTGETVSCTLSHDTFFHPVMDKILNDIPHAAVLSNKGVEIQCYSQNLQQIQSTARNILSLRQPNDKKAPLSFYIESTKDKVNSNTTSKYKTTDLVVER